MSDIAPAHAAHPPSRGRRTVFDQRNQVGRALADLWRGFAAWELWAMLGWHDIRQRYKRSVIGPFWLTLSMAVLILGMGVLYAGLFGISGPDYVPFLALGFIFWTYLSNVMLEGCTVFYAAGGMIKQVPAPLSSYVYRLVWRNLIIFFHNFVIFIGIAIYFGIWPGVANILIACLGLGLIVLTSVPVVLFLGLISARFRDIPQMVASAVQIFFFITPIFWKPEQLPGRALIVEANPFRHFLDIVRQPLLGQPSHLHSWLIVLAIMLVAWAVSFALYVKYRRRLAYWV